MIRELAEEERGIDPRDRHHRLGQVDDARRDGRPHQLDPREAHRHDRGPDRVPAPRQAVDHQPARGRHGHRLLPPRAAPRPAPGPGRDPDRRDARRGDGQHRAVARPRPATSCCSTLHTVDAAETVNRIIDFFPPHQQQQVRAMLAGTLKGVISQRLVPTPDGNGRVAACEILRMTGRVRDMIIDPDADRPPARGDRRGRATTACRPSTRRCSSTARPGAIAMDEALKAAHPPARLQAAGGLRRPPRDLDGRPRPGGDRAVEPWRGRRPSLGRRSP